MRPDGSFVDPPIVSTQRALEVAPYAGVAAAVAALVVGVRRRRASSGRRRRAAALEARLGRGEVVALPGVRPDEPVGGRRAP